MTHQDFPSVTFQIAKNNFCVEEEEEEIFDSKKVTEVPQENVVPPPSANEGSPNNQSIHLSRSNPSSSINRQLISTVSSQRGNLDVSDLADILALGLQIDNEDPLPENLPNVGTMNKRAEPVGRWICPIVCPHVQEANGRNLNGRFSKMSWEIVAEADELELFKVSNF